MAPSPDSLLPPAALVAGEVNAADAAEAHNVTQEFRPVLARSGCARQTAALPPPAHSARAVATGVHRDVEGVHVSVQEQQVAAARRAVRDLSAAVEGLERVFPPSVDLRRLAEDTARITVDLDLLAGGRTPQPAVAVEIIQDVEYPASLFEGADDEGLGPRRR
jgi:hypothetical protein